MPKLISFSLNLRNRKQMFNSQRNRSKISKLNIKNLANSMKMEIKDLNMKVTQK